MNIFNENLTIEELHVLKKIAPELTITGKNFYPDYLVDTLWVVFQKVRSNLQKPSTVEQARLEFCESLKKVPDFCR